MFTNNPTPDPDVSLVPDPLQARVAEILTLTANVYVNAFNQAQARGDKDPLTAPATLTIFPDLTQDQYCKTLYMPGSVDHQEALRFASVAPMMMSGRRPKATLIGTVGHGMRVDPDEFDPDKFGPDNKLADNPQAQPIMIFSWTSLPTEDTFLNVSWLVAVTVDDDGTFKAGGWDVATSSGPIEDIGDRAGGIPESQAILLAQDERYWHKEGAEFVSTVLSDVDGGALREGLVAGLYMLAPDERTTGLQIAAGIAASLISVWMPWNADYPISVMGFDVSEGYIPSVTASKLVEEPGGFSFDREQGWDTENMYKTWSLLFAEHIAAVRSSRGTPTSMAHALEAIVQASLAAVKSGKADTPWFPGG